MSFYSEFAEHYEAVFPFEQSVYDFLREEAGGRVARALDIGCGTGDYCGRFAEDGGKAVGIDLDPWMIERARARYPAAEFHVMNMAEAGSLDGPFDLAFCIGNVAAHMRRASFGALLSSVGGLLSAGASWVVQTVNWDFVLSRGSYDFPDVHVEEGALTFERRYLDVTEESVTFATALRSGERVVFEGETVLHPVTSDDYVRMHAEAGFTLRGRYGSFGRESFDASVPSSCVMSFVRG
jgi:SAM-dependent methyltransferase